MIGISIEFNLPAGTSADLLTKPMQRFLMEGMTLTHGYLVTPGVTPVDTEVLRTSLQPGTGTTGIDTARPPLWFKVGTDVEYAGVLDSGARNQHYAGGPSKGEPIKGWLSDSPKAVGPMIEQILPYLAADIQKTWGGG